MLTNNYNIATLPQIKSVERHGLNCYRYEIDSNILANKTTNSKNDG